MRDKLQSIAKRFISVKSNNEQPLIGFPIAYEPQIHEQDIIAHFTENTQQLIPNDTKEVVKNNYILCFTNRCGSNWLAELMHSTELIGLADEYFNAPRLIRDYGDYENFSQVIADIANHESQISDKFFCKLSWDQLFFLKKYRIIPDMLPNTKYILMHRRDVAAQALSEISAEQTGQWTSNWNSGKNGKLDLGKITDQQIQSKIDEITIKYQQFNRYFATFGITPTHIYYEDLLENPSAEITKIVDTLELNKNNTNWQIKSSEVKLKKQSGSKSQKRLDAFYANMHNHTAELVKTEMDVA